MAASAFIRHMQKHADTAEVMRKTRVYAGSSSGAIVALMCCLGMRECDVLWLERTVDLSTLTPDAPWYAPWQPWVRLVRQFGLYPTDKIRQCLLEATRAYGFDADTTFAELYAVTGKDLMVTITNLNRQQPVVLSRRSTPDFVVIDAICASCAIPLVFTPSVATAGVVDARSGAVLISPGDVLVDGGVAMSNPDEQLQHHVAEPTDLRVLSVRFTSTASRANLRSLPPCAGLWAHWLRVLEAVMNSAEYLGDQQFSTTAHAVVELDASEFSVLNTVGRSLSAADRCTLESIGANAAARYRAQARG